MADDKNEQPKDAEPSASKSAVGNKKITINIDKIDLVNSRFPFCLVWTPTPILSWLLPFFGHVGIATSTGIIRDFPFPYRVRENRMAFGKPAIYVQLSKDKAFNGEAGWDAAVTEASHIFKKKMHFLFFQNCHSHVSKALNLMQYEGCTTWNGFDIDKMIFTQGLYVSRKAVAKTWLPFTILLLVIIIIIIIATANSEETM